AAKLAEEFCEAGPVFSGAWIARRNGTAGAGIAAFKRDFADFETHDVIFIGSEELVFPKRRYTFDLECGAEAFARFIQRDSGEPVADRLQGSGGDDRGAGSEAVVGKAFARVADDDRLLEIVAEPLCGFLRFGRELDANRLNAAVIFGSGEADAREI